MYAMEEAPTPIESGQLEGQRVIKITAGHSHAACIVEGGNLFFWGMSLYLEPELVTSLLHTKVSHHDWGFVALVNFFSYCFVSLCFFRLLMLSVEKTIPLLSEKMEGSIAWVKARQEFWDKPV